MQETIDSMLRRNIKDVRSQKLRQQPMNVNSRNELLQQYLDKNQVSPLKNYEFRFAHESQDDFIEGDKKLTMEHKTEKMKLHSIGIGPVHQDIDLITAKSKEL